MRVLAALDARWLEDSLRHVLCLEPVIHEVCNGDLAGLLVESDREVLTGNLHRIIDDGGYMISMCSDTDAVAKVVGIVTQLLANDPAPSEAGSEYELKNVSLDILCHVTSNFSFPTDAILNSGFIELILRRLLLDTSAYKHKYVVILGNLIGDGPRATEHLLETGIVEFLETAIQMPLETPFLTDLGWVLCNLNRHIRDKAVTLTVAQQVSLANVSLQYAIGLFKGLLDDTNPDVSGSRQKLRGDSFRQVYYAFWALLYASHSNICADVFLDGGLLTFIAQVLFGSLLDHRVRQPAIRCLQRVVMSCTNPEVQLAPLLTPEFLHYLLTGEQSSMLRGFNAEIVTTLLDYPELVPRLSSTFWELCQQCRKAPGKVTHQTITLFQKFTSDDLEPIMGDCINEDVYHECIKGIISEIPYHRDNRETRCAILLLLRANLERMVGGDEFGVMLRESDLAPLIASLSDDLDLQTLKDDVLRYIGPE
ncbi:hypothetical protein GMRT_10598 [Giardia muris]|uniref:Uncharacterized protein n=1 Tax=Giardia muris TaxID=5742 RepID=A0A4Z1SYT0_GIAMU|nr:hypothetical protein GMRT_10598 [Giardia muris]|eukprot:TNJ26823.1 hypothetical protein GMRT_10598 [Giardia muris]